MTIFIGPHRTRAATWFLEKAGFKMLHLSFDYDIRPAAELAEFEALLVRHPPGALLLVEAWQGLEKVGSPEAVGLDKVAQHLRRAIERKESYSVG